MYLTLLCGRDGTWSVLPLYISLHDSLYDVMEQPQVYLSPELTGGGLGFMPVHVFSFTLEIMATKHICSLVDA